MHILATLTGSQTFDDLCVLCTRPVPLPEEGGRPKRTLIQIKSVNHVVLLSTSNSIANSRLFPHCGIDFVYCNITSL